MNEPASLNNNRNPDPDHRDRVRRANDASVNVFSRVIAVMTLMMVPGILGYFIDRWLGSQFVMIIGILLGMVGGTLGLLNIARQATQELDERKKS